MNADRFAACLRTLPGVSSRRGILRVLSGLGMGSLRVPSDAAAKRKKKKKKKHKKKHPTCSPLCDGKSCGDNGCGGSCGTCGSDEACQDGRCVCIPDSQATTCAGTCATRTNNCGQVVTCPCQGGKTCLTNRSCADICSLTDPCPSGCICGGPSPEGPSHCVQQVSACDQIPQTCATTAACPTGQHCQSTACGPQPRCVPLCPQ